MRQPKELAPEATQAITACIDKFCGENTGKVDPAQVRRAVLWKARGLRGKKTVERYQMLASFETLHDFAQWRLATEKKRNERWMKCIYRKLPRDIMDGHNALYVFGRVKQMDPEDKDAEKAIIQVVQELNSALSLKLWV